MRIKKVESYKIFFKFAVIVELFAICLLMTMFLTAAAFSFDAAEGDHIVVCTESGLRVRRSKLFKRQSRLPEEREVRKQTSEPAPPPPAPPVPPLQKHESYPQYPGKNRRSRTQDQDMGSLLIRAVTVIDRQPSTSGSDAAAPEAPAHRASHTPAVRAGPPLSCNFCWNTVDEFGRILRRKTQYHCPECRTNLCIVPCFHEYHDGPEFDPASAR